jgi:hypothetical protein
MDSPIGFENLNFDIACRDSAGRAGNLNFVSIDLGKQFLSVFGDEFDNVLIESFPSRQGRCLRDGRLSPVRVASMAISEAPDVRHGVIHDLAFHCGRGCFVVAFLRRRAVDQRYRGRGTEVRGWRHGCDVAGQQNVGPGAICAGAGRRHIGGHGHGRSEYVLHDFTHRLHQAAGRIHRNNN